MMLPIKSQTIADLPNIQLLYFAESAIRRYEPNEIFPIVWNKNLIVHQNFVWIYLDEVIHLAIAML